MRSGNVKMAESERRLRTDSTFELVDCSDMEEYGDLIGQRWPFILGNDEHGSEVAWGELSMLVEHNWDISLLETNRVAIKTKIGNTFTFERLS